METQGKGVREWEGKRHEEWEQVNHTDQALKNFIQEWQYKHKQEEASREGRRSQGLSEGQVSIFSSWNQWSQCLTLMTWMFSQDCLCKLENIHKAMAEVMAPGISSLLIIFTKAPQNWDYQ